jgi:hypothetical protein
MHVQIDEARQQQLALGIQLLERDAVQARRFAKSNRVDLPAFDQQPAGAPGLNRSEESRVVDK